MPDIIKKTAKDQIHGDESKSVQSVERALLIVEALAENGKPMTLGDLAQKVKLNPSTVHRLLATLMHRDFVDQDEYSRYKLAMKLFHIGNAATYAMDIKKIASPFMQELLEQCNETVNLAILDRYEVVYIDQLESNNIVIVRMFARVGKRGPAHCTGSGKVLLAGLSHQEISRYLARVELQKFTSETITDPSMLMKELENIRKNAYALDLGEREEGVRCVAVPIKNYEGRTVAALSVSGPSMRITNSYINNVLTPIVTDAGERLSHKLGYKNNSE